MLSRKALTAGINPHLPKAKVRGSYTTAIHKRLVDAAKLGANVETMAQVACITSGTFRQWMIKSLYYESDPEKYATYEAYYNLRNEIEEAWGTTKMLCLASVLKAAQGRQAKLDQDGNELEKALDPDWRAAAWFLERNDPAYAKNRADIPEEDPVFDEDASVDPAPAEKPSVPATLDAAELMAHMTPEQLRALAYGPQTDLKK